MPSWCRQAVLYAGIALLGWLLMQEMNTEGRLTHLETSLEDMEERLEVFTDKVLPMLKAKDD